MEPRIIELPNACSGPADDLWRIEFKMSDCPAQACEGKHWVDGASRAEAEIFLRQWRIGSEGVAIFCSRCPSGRAACPHADAPRFRYADMVDARIMPMREAV